MPKIISECCELVKLCRINCTVRHTVYSARSGRSCKCNSVCGSKRTSFGVQVALKRAVVCLDHSRCSK